MDRPEASSVARGHVGVKRLNGVGAGHFPVLFVHVVGTGARVVSQPNSEILDLLGMLLVDLRRNCECHSGNVSFGSTYGLDADNLASCLLDLSETAQEIPEPGLGNRLVGSEDGHAVHVRSRVGLGGQMAPNDLVFLKTTYEASPVSVLFMAYPERRMGKKLNLAKGRRHAVNHRSTVLSFWRTSEHRYRSDAAITNTRTTWLLVHIVSGERASLELNIV